MSDLFKPEDFKLPKKGYFPSEEHQEMLATRLNNLLKERLEIGYTVKNADGYAEVGDEAVACDTHKIYYFTEPIEEEKPKCDHTVKDFKIVQRGDGIALTISAIEFVNTTKNPNIMFCPKCGDNLR
jgi:hypothetical protein